MSGVDVLAVLDEVAHFHDNGSEAFDSLRESRAAVAELIFAAEQMRIDLNITRSNIMAEIAKGRDRWDGVPEILEHRISAFDAALSRVRGCE